MSGSNCCFLTCIQISQEAGKVVWYSHLFQNIPQFVVSHIVKGFSIVNEAEVDILLEFSCFFYDPMDVVNLISDSSAFSKSSLYIWKFSIHILLKASLKDFEHYFASMWNECSCAVVWTFFGIAFFGTGMKTNLFQSCSHCCVFQICCHIECSTLTASSFRILFKSISVDVCRCSLRDLILFLWLHHYLNIDNSQICMSVSTFLLNSICDSYMPLDIATWIFKRHLKF